MFIWLSTGCLGTLLCVHVCLVYCVRACVCDLPGLLFFHTLTRKVFDNLKGVRKEWPNSRYSISIILNRFSSLQLDCFISNVYYLNTEAKQKQLAGQDVWTLLMICLISIVNHKGPYRSVFICRVQDLRELGELSPHWDNLRKEVMTRYGGIICSYQETLAELDKITGMTAPAFIFIPVSTHVFMHTRT